MMTDREVAEELKEMLKDCSPSQAISIIITVSHDRWNTLTPKQRNKFADAVVIAFTELFPDLRFYF